MFYWPDSTHPLPTCDISIIPPSPRGQLRYHHPGCAAQEYIDLYSPQGTSLLSFFFTARGSACAGLIPGYQRRLETRGERRAFVSSSWSAGPGGGTGVAPVSRRWARTEEKREARPYSTRMGRTSGGFSCLDRVADPGERLRDGIGGGLMISGGRRG